MGTPTMNIESAIWAAPGSVTCDEEALLSVDQGGDIVEHAAGLDTAVANSRVVNIRGLYTIGFNDRATFNGFFSKVGTEASMVMKVKDMDAATGEQITGALSKLQRVFVNAQYNAPTLYTAVFYARSADGAALPMSAEAY